MALKNLMDLFHLEGIRYHGRGYWLFYVFHDNNYYVIKFLSEKTGFVIDYISSLDSVPTYKSKREMIKKSYSLECNFEYYWRKENGKRRKQQT